ncbi:MAG TPA: tripartite tricarboxylate transporter permease, partial [Candidatus Nanoarchaeia archaeon]|nr:tripartite tricarboxylate transporter permease [Candidatus Nanoarchaeia archaeon]
MLFELLIALSIGIIFGTFTGLSPGIHINLVAAFLVSISSILLRFTEPIYLVVFIVAMGIAHTFID